MESVIYLKASQKKIYEELSITTDRQKIIDLLMEMLHHASTFQVVWLFRFWLEKLTMDEIDQNPALKCALIEIEIYKGNLKNAKALLETLDHDSIYYLLTLTTMPGISDQEYIDVLKKLKTKNLKPNEFVYLSTARPTTLCAIHDYTRRLGLSEQEFVELIEVIYPNRADLINEVMNAEILYQKNKCYESLIKIVSVTPILKERQSLRLLLTPLSLQTYILVLNHQATSAKSLMDSVRQELEEADLRNFFPNMDALEAWASMYDGDYALLTKWMREKAPDEYGRFFMLDLFRYMIKMRGYIVQGKDLALTYLANKLLPILEAGKRPMDIAELYTVWAIGDFYANRKQEALSHIGKAIDILEPLGYYRLIADEGSPVYEILKEYRHQYGQTPYLKELMRLTHAVALNYPKYLKRQLPEGPALTKKELYVLKLLAQGHSNQEIADISETSINNIKAHCKHIYAKLEVKNRKEAVNKAFEIGIIERGNYSD